MIKYSGIYHRWIIVGEWRLNMIGGQGVNNLNLWDFSDFSDFRDFFGLSESFESIYDFFWARPGAGVAVEDTATVSLLTYKAFLAIPLHASRSLPSDVSACYS